MTIALLEAREAEARRIARDLHDEASQMLAVARLALDDLSAHVPAERLHEVERVHDALREAEEDLRRIAHDLRPRVLDDLGLKAALETLARHARRRSSASIRTSIDVDGRLPDRVETHLYRIAQEAVANALRHGRPRMVSIRLSAAGDGVVLAVEDDGRGLPARFRAGLGLRGMRERAAALGGWLDLDSNPGHGTTVTAHVPLQVDPCPRFAS